MTAPDVDALFTKQPSAQDGAVDRGALVSEILSINATADAAFLDEFDTDALRRYRDHLLWGATPRPERPAWVRHGETPAIVSREPAD